MSLRFIKPIGYYPPLIWSDSLKSNSISRLYLFMLTVSNLLLRFIFYPFNFIFSNIITLGFVITATVFNIGWLLGGAFSNTWSNTTKTLNQIAFTRCLWLILDGFGFLWNQSKLFLGILFAPLAIQTMNDIKEFVEPLTETSLFHWDWQEPHQKMVTKLANSLSEYNFHTLRMFICTLAGEPVDAIVSGVQMLRGIGELHEFGLNPDKLTTTQAQYPALLCLHGNYHNQSAWLSLAQYLQERKYPGPIFTLNLPSGKTSHQDTELIKQKLQSIKQCYLNAQILEEKIKINIVGHSRGSYLGYLAGFQGFDIDQDQRAIAESKVNPLINKTILMGSSSYDLPEYRKSNPPTYINGRYDSLVFFKQDPRESDELLVNTGHLGVLSDPEALEHCYITLVSTNP